MGDNHDQSDQAAGRDVEVIDVPDDGVDAGQSDVVAEAGKRGLKRKMQQDDHTEGPPTKKIRLSHDLTKSCTQCRRRKRK